MVLELNDTEKGSLWKRSKDMDVGFVADIDENKLQYMQEGNDRQKAVDQFQKDTYEIMRIVRHLGKMRMMIIVGAIPEILYGVKV